MTVTPPRRRSRVSTIVIVVVLVAVVAGTALIAVLGAAGARSTDAASASPGVSASSSGTPAAVGPTSAAATPAPVVTAAKPHPTRTAAIASPAPITRSLTARVTKIEAVSGTAEGPGEIAGPAVRFTVAIANRSGKRVSLSNTVVNGYYGAASTPALELQGPGGKPFPSSVADGATVTGVFVFTIPRSQRARVEVTVDTSVKNPVVAFRGAAPR